jgi:hypothetical protein
LLAHGWWLSLGTPPSSTTKIDRHDTAKILLKMAKNQKSNQIIHDKELSYYELAISSIEDYC